MNYVGFRLSVVMATLHNVKHKRNLGMRIKVEKQVGELNEEKRWCINKSSINVNVGTQKGG